MATYSIRDLGRREILIMSAVLAGARVPLSPKLAAAEATLQRTPDQILGPFYPLSELPQTSDLTKYPVGPVVRSVYGSSERFLRMSLFQTIGVPTTSNFLVQILNRP